MLRICLGQISETSKPEILIGLLAITALCCYGLWAFLRWFLGGPSAPDPWDAEVSAQLAEGNCTPLCHHCLAAHEPSANFCPERGAAVGDCTNLLPFPYLFSIGHALRIGTDERFKRSPLTVGGFFFLGHGQWIEAEALFVAQHPENITRWNAAQRVMPFDRIAESVASSENLPGAIMNRHGVGQGAVEVEDQTLRTGKGR